MTPSPRGQVFSIIGDIALQRHLPDMDQADELGMCPLQTHCHRSLGNLHRQTGQIEQARAELFAAIELYRDMQMTFWLPQVEYDTV